MRAPPPNATQAPWQRLHTHPAWPGVLTELQRKRAAIESEMHARAMAEVPAFTDSHDPAAISGLRRHGPQLVQHMLAQLASNNGLDLRFVGEHARQRADSRFPLEAMLHTYRSAHKVALQAVHQAALAQNLESEPALALVMALTDFCTDYFDAVNTCASTAYVEQARLLVDVAGDQRAQLLNLLLNGYDESDARVAAILRAAGYLDGRQAFVVVLARPVDAAEMDHPARARRLADSLDQLVPKHLARRLIDVRDGRVVGVFSGVRRTSGWTVPNASLAHRIGHGLATAGNGVLIGISADVVSTAQIPSAFRQALLASRLTGLNRRVVPFSEVALPQLMIHLAGDELQRLLPGWAHPLHQADDQLGGTLSATLHAYADADMNLLKAAARLDLHPNTVYARFNRIRDITGLNARNYRALTDMLTVLEARKH